MSILLDILNHPDQLTGLKESQWDHLLRQARKSFLMGTLADRAEAQDAVTSAPLIARNQMKAGKILSAKIALDIGRELRHVADAVRGFDHKIILLKGAAYLKAGLPAAQGRMFGDIDILVRRSDLPGIEKLLNQAGWSTDGTAAYDETYYRRWTHELPPMEHIDRGNIIDVHHAIVQERGTMPISRDVMIEQAVGIDGPFSILRADDMVLHACVHLFNDGEFDKGLRDLLDIVALVRHFDASQPNFRADLLRRACEISFQTQLYYGMRYGQMLLGLAHPSGWLDHIRPAGHRDRWMDALFARALEPDHATANDVWSHWARRILYFRGHYLRMPMRHLLPHLVRKSLTPQAPHPGMQAPVPQP